MTYNNTRHPKQYVYFNPPNPPVDTYLQGRSEYEIAYPIFNTGITKPIYNLQGNIAKSLPLEEWPYAGTYHPEVKLMKAYGMGGPPGI